jgi:hypothetical protein
MMILTITDPRVFIGYSSVPKVHPVKCIVGMV